MKFFLNASFIAILFLWAAPASSAEKTGGGGTAVSPQEAAQVLYDFREYVDVKSNLSPGEEQRLFRRLFPEYLKRGQDCDFENFKFGENGVEEDHKTGQFAPFVDSVAHGAFTGPGRKETAYLVRMGECHAGHGFQTQRLVVIAGNGVVAQPEVPEILIRKISDLDGDGVQELLLEGIYTNMGETYTYARLVGLLENRLKVIKDFKQVGFEFCEEGRSDGTIRATVITYQPKGAGMMPEFQSNSYEAKCPAQGAKAQFKPTDKAMNK